MICYRLPTRNLISSLFINNALPQQLRALINKQQPTQIKGLKQKRAQQSNGLKMKKVHYSYSSSSDYSNSHKYANKTTKQIQKQMGYQKWKALQNTFKSLSSSFNLKKPTQAELQSKNSYSTPKKIQYNLQSLRECSYNYPVYLYWELQKKNSPFSQVIQKVLDNLWKAEKKELLQFLQFLYHWDYKYVEIQKLYEIGIQKFDLSMSELFTILKKFDNQINRADNQSKSQIYKIVEIKTVERINKLQIQSSEYGDLLKIVNYFTVRNLMSEQFYQAVLNIMKENINNIQPNQALEAYIYFTYNISQHVNSVSKTNPNDKKQNEPGKVQTQGINEQKVQQDDQQQNSSRQTKSEDLGLNILSIIQARILSPECLKFYTGQKLVALLHTFLKNNLILTNQNITNKDSYDSKIQKIIEKIQLSYYAADFSPRDKLNLLDICILLPDLKKKTIIALIQNQLYKRGQKFDHQVLAGLYLVSYQANMLSQQMRVKIEESIIDKIFQIEKKDLSRIIWIATITNSSNSGKNRLNILHKKLETIIEGGLKDFSIKDVSIIVWSMCCMRYKPEGKFWNNMQSYLIEQLQFKTNKSRKIDGPQKQNMQESPVHQIKNDNRKLVNDCCWILWAYHNNRQLHMQTIDIICDILISQFSNKFVREPKNTQSQKNAELQIEQQNLLTPFQLTSIISFFYSINLPANCERIVNQIKQISYTQFGQIYQTMQPIQLCKCLKYIGTQGSQVWRDKKLYDGILQIFEDQLQRIVYRDIMTVVAILIGSGVKNKRVALLINKLIERKKRLQSLQKFGTEQTQEQSSKQDQQSKWKFPI